MRARYGSAFTGEFKSSGGLALAAQAEAKQRFEREARAAARLQSKRIVTVLEVGEHRQLPYLD